MITFSFSPTSWSTLPSIAASVSTLVVSWNDAAEMKHSVDSDALVMPSSSGSAIAGSPPFVQYPVVFLFEAPLLDLITDQRIRCHRPP